MTGGGCSDELERDMIASLTVGNCECEAEEAAAGATTAAGSPAVGSSDASASEEPCEDEGLSAGFAALFAELGLPVATTFFTEELAADAAVTGLLAAAVEAAAEPGPLLLGLLEERAVAEPVALLFFAEDDFDDAFEEASEATVGVAVTGVAEYLETNAGACTAAGGRGLTVGAAAAAAAAVDGDPLEDDVADFLAAVAGVCCAVAAHCGLSERCQAFGSGEGVAERAPLGAGAVFVETTAGIERGCVVGVPLALLLLLPPSPLFWRDCGCCDTGLLLELTLAAIAAAQVETGGVTSAAGGAGTAGGGLCCECVCGLVLRLPLLAAPLLLVLGTSCGMRNCNRFLSSREGRGS